MRLPIEYEEARRCWPEAVAEIVAKLRKGKSAHRDADPSTLEWGIEWCVRVRGFTFGEIVNRDVLPPTPGERAKENAKNSTAWLGARKGRWAGTSSALKDLPQEVEDFYARSAKGEEEEQARIAALTPEERTAEVKKALAVLSKGKGFVAIHARREKR